MVGTLVPKMLLRLPSSLEAEDPPLASGWSKKPKLDQPGLLPDSTATGLESLDAFTACPTWMGSLITSRFC